MTTQTAIVGFREYVFSKHMGNAQPIGFAVDDKAVFLLEVLAAFLVGLLLARRLF
jgi:hypothetical protein